MNAVLVKTLHRILRPLPPYMVPSLLLAQNPYYFRAKIKLDRKCPTATTAQVRILSQNMCFIEVNFTKEISTSSGLRKINR